MLMLLDISIRTGTTGDLDDSLLVMIDGSRAKNTSRTNPVTLRAARAARLEKGRGGRVRLYAHRA
jgi:hypothetical protein